MANSIKAQMIEVTNNFGHSAPILELAASVGWNAKWASSCHQGDLARAAQMLAQAAEILAKVEAQEEEAKEGIREIEASIKSRKGDR